MKNVSASLGQLPEVFLMLVTCVLITWYFWWTHGLGH